MSNPYRLMSLPDVVIEYINANANVRALPPELEDMVESVKRQNRLIRDGEEVRPPIGHVIYSPRVVPDITSRPRLDVRRGDYRGV